MAEEQVVINNIDELINLLNFVLSGDNAKIQQATKPQSVPNLATILATNPNVWENQIIITSIGDDFDQKAHDETTQKQLKEVILNRFFTEEISIIRTNIGQLIGSIAQQTLKENKWPELYQILQQQTQKNQELLTRQRGLVLLSLVFDYSGDSLKPFYSAFYQFFVENLQDQDKVIRVQTVKCLIALFDNIQYMDKQEAQQYKTLVEPILNIVDQCLKEGDEDTAYNCFDAFSYLADSKLTILDTHLGLIIEYAASPNILQNPKCSSRFKECVIDFIYSVAEVHRKILQKNAQLLRKLIESLCLLIAEPIQINEFADGEDSIQDVALWFVETLCIVIQKKKPLFGVLLEAVTLLIESQDGNKMNAGFLILAAMSEGLQDQLRRSLTNPIMNKLIPIGLQDQRIEVRGGAIKALTYFAEWLQPEFIIYDNVVIPQMLSNLLSLDPRLREKGLLAIDIFCENMEKDKIAPYLPQLIPTLVQVFLQPQTTFVARRHCLSSIGSVISSSKELFATYLNDVSQLLLKVMDEKDTPEIIGIKAEAITVLGKIAESFSANQEVQNVLVTPLSARVFQILQTNQDFEIRESCLSFFYNQASAQKQAFAQVFDQVIDFTLKLAQSQEGISYEKHKKEEFSLDTESEDDEEIGVHSNVRVKVTQLDEKAAAIHALGQFALAVPLKFGPYYKPCFDILQETIQFFYENIRIQTVQCYCDLIESAVMFYNNGVIPTYNPGLPCVQRLNQELEIQIQTDIFQKFLLVLTDDESVDAVTTTLDGIEHLTKKIGPAFIDGNLNQLNQTIFNLLERKAKCYGNDDDEDIEENQEQEEEVDDEDTNANVYESLTELIPTLAKVLKGGFLVTWQTIFPSLMQYTNTEKDINDIIQTIGCIAQVFEFEPQTIQYSHQIVLPVLFKATQERDVELNRNTAYCLATFSEFGPEELVLQNIPSILQTLQVVYSECGPYQAAQDNAAAALCRIICRFPQTVPVAQVLENIIKIMPFKGDELEEFTAIKMLLFLGDTQPALIQPHIEFLIKILLDALLQKEKYKIKAEQQVTIQNALKGLAGNAQYKAIIEQQLITLPEVQRTQLIQLLQ